MSKYIIELNDKCARGIVVFGKKDEEVISTTQYVENLEVLNSDYINENFGDLQDDAYERGHEIGYQKGFEDGKAVHEKGCEGCEHECENKMTQTCILCCNAYKNRWIAKSDKIEVGDEVEWDNDFTGDRFIVTRIYQPYGEKEQCDGIDDDGDVYRAVLIESLVKTGRHFDIESILEEMRND